MTRAIPAMLLCLCLMFAGLPATLAKDKDGEAGTQEIMQRLEELSKKIDTLEKNLMQRMNALDSKIAAIPATAGAPQKHPLETEAQNEFGKIRKLVSDGKMEEAKTKMTTFLEKYGATDTAKAARRMHQEVLSVIGKEAPAEWGIEKWFQGEAEVDLASDKTTLLVFWETWCPHCKREVPKLESIYNALKDQGLQVVGFTRITKSSTEEIVQQFITDNKITSPIAKEDGKVGGHFSVRGIPAAAVMKDGKVIWRGHPGELDEAKLKRWL
jgi:thiol-disulfide isomerase/thioredoxin